MSERTFSYIRYMRDGSTKELHGMTNDQKRVRKGKTAKDRAARK